MPEEELVGNHARRVVNLRRGINIRILNAMKTMSIFWFRARFPARPRIPYYTFYAMLYQKIAGVLSKIGPSSDLLEIVASVDLFTTNS